MGRSLKNLIEVVEGLDTTTNGGKLIFHIFGALAEFERNLIRERTRAGLEAARSRGRTGGRKKKLSDKQIETMRLMYESKKHTVNEICQTLGISKPTLYKWMARKS